jgi:hypothetical protein
MYYTWAYVGLISSILVSVYALLRGGPAERYGVVMFLIAWLATTLVQKTTFDGIEWGIVVVDALLLIAFVILTLWARKVWTVLIAACQLNAVLSHFVPLLAPKFNYVSYITVVAFWGGYGLLACLAAGTYSHQRELRLERTAPHE